ncbi:unnamed protein product [Hydatigera taeniaeformis]|uniref:TAXi_C domain-containing protein n=1 Tax=Hydatigena taeniaeformis TaxID=6205 RepID=A0A0R3X949_HYDTA|nr:unnamed protein product [Hydatigera taeniaeformis]
MRRHLPPPLLRPLLLLPRLGSTLLRSARVGSLSFIRIGWRFRLFDSLPRLLSSNCSASLVAHDGCTAGQYGGMKLTKRRKAITFVAGFSGDLFFLPFPTHLSLLPHLHPYMQSCGSYSAARLLRFSTGGVAILLDTSSMTLMELRRLTINEDVEWGGQSVSIGFSHFEAFYSI